MNKEETVSPSDKIERKMAERNVLNVEMNGLNKLRLSKDISEIERKLTKEYYDFLDYKALILDKEIYKVFYEELPADNPNRAEILEKIEDEGVQGWTYKSDIPVKPNPLLIDSEVYRTLPYREKVQRKIAEYRFNSAVLDAVSKRCKSKKLSTYEIELLKKRERELKNFILSCIQEIWRITWDEMPPSATDLLDIIKCSGITQERYDKVYSFLQKGIKNV